MKSEECNLLRDQIMNFKESKPMNIVVNTSNDEVIKLYKAQLESYQAAFSSLLESKKVQIQ